MNAKIFVIAGHNIRSQGAMGYDGVSEHTRTTDLQKRVTLGVSSMQNLEGSHMSMVTEDEVDSNSSVRVKIKEHHTPKSRGIDIHFNNNNPAATGCEVVISPHTSVQNKRRAIWMINTLSQAIGLPIRRRDSSRDFIYPSETFVKSLPIIERTPIPMILLEVCFLNSTDLPKYIGNEDKVAAIIRRGLLTSFNEEGSERMPFIYRGTFYKSSEKTV